MAPELLRCGTNPTGDTNLFCGQLSPKTAEKLRKLSRPPKSTTGQGINQCVDLIFLSKTVRVSYFRGTAGGLQSTSWEGGRNLDRKQCDGVIPANCHERPMKW